MSTGGILQGRIKLQPPGKHTLRIPKLDNKKTSNLWWKDTIKTLSKTIKTINQWDARDAPMKSIEGTCQDWLQLLTGGITQDALHMHSATVALVAAPAICCLHLNMLHVTHVQNIDSVKMHIEESYVFRPSHVAHRDGQRVQTTLRKLTVRKAERWPKVGQQIACQKEKTSYSTVSAR